MSDDAIERIAKDVAAIKAALAAGAVAFASALGATMPASGGATGKGGGVASDRELDGPYGNIEIKKDPPRWGGQPYAPCRLSETEPDYLDVLADFLDWRADKDDESGAKDNKGRPKSHWSRKDARLARGWAARMRAGWKPKTNGAAAEDYGDDADDPANW